MSMTACRAYFRENSLTEWTDGFSYQNIPANLINKSFHIELGGVSAISRNQHAQEMEASVTVRIFLKGYRDPASAIDSVVTLAENLVKNACKVANSLTQTSGIKNVMFESFRAIPLGASNDNLVIGEVNFRVNLALNLES